MSNSTYDPSYTSAYIVPKSWPKRPRVKPPAAIRGTKITILGCGTSSGVPLIGCTCKVCRSKNPKNHRTRASVTIQTGNKTFLIDTAPDLREQAFRSKLLWIDAVLFTHPHADHVHGIDELRSYNYLMARPIECYGNEWTVRELPQKFDYIFRKPAAEAAVGGGRPMLEIKKIEEKTSIHGVEVIPLPLIHGKMPVLGYRIKNVAYITDCSVIPDSTIDMLKGLDVLVLDCLRYTEHETHLRVDESLDYARKIGAKKTYFTHMGHEIDYSAFSRSLPRNIQPAYDGQIIRA